MADPNASWYSSVKRMADPNASWYSSVAVGEILWATSQDQLNMRKLTDGRETNAESLNHVLQPRICTGGNVESLGRWFESALDAFTEVLVTAKRLHDSALLYFFNALVLKRNVAIYLCIQFTLTSCRRLSWLCNTDQEQGDQPHARHNVRISVHNRYLHFHRRERERFVARLLVDKQVHGDHKYLRIESSDDVRFI